MNGEQQSRLPGPGAWPCQTKPSERIPRLLVALFYRLMRDELAAGVVEQILIDIDGQTEEPEYTNPHLEALARSHAAFVARRDPVLKDLLQVVHDTYSTVEIPKGSRGEATVSFDKLTAMLTLARELHGRVNGYAHLEPVVFPEEDLKWDLFRAEGDLPNQGPSGLTLTHKPSRAQVATSGPGSMLSKRERLLNQLREHAAVLPDGTIEIHFTDGFTGRP